MALPYRAAQALATAIATRFALRRVPSPFLLRPPGYGGQVEGEGNCAAYPTVPNCA